MATAPVNRGGQRAGRAANRDGTVYRRSDGGWIAEVRWVDRFGKRQRASRRAATEAEARRKLRELRRIAHADEAPGDRHLTVEGYWHSWSRGPLLAGDRKPATIQTYRTLARVHVLPAIGGIRLRHLRPGDVETLLAGMRLSRPGRGGQAGDPVSGQTRRTTLAMLSLMLDTAVRDGLVTRNVAADVARPKVDTPEAFALSREQLRDVLAAARGTRLEPLLLLLASTGLRLGEALALRWEDVDLDTGMLRVTGTVRGAGSSAHRTAPKSLRSRRSLPLPEPVRTSLRAWKATQASERLRAGTAWHRGPHSWVFTTASGHVLDQRNAARQYERVLRGAGLDVPARFHVFRHTAASLMLADGRTSLRTAAEVLGHASTSLTADLYGHVQVDAKTAAIAVIGEALA